MELRKCKILFITNLNRQLNLVKMSLEMNCIVISIDSILILIILAHFFTNYLAIKMQAFWHLWVSLELIVLQSQSLFVEYALMKPTLEFVLLSLMWMASLPLMKAYNSHKNWCLSLNMVGCQQLACKALLTMECPLKFLWQASWFASFQHLGDF